MRYAILALFLFALPVAAHPDDDAAAALALALAKHKAAPMPAKHLGYDVGANEAVARGCPLVTFVGCQVKEGAGWGVIFCGAKSLPGYDGPCIVVSVPDNAGWLQWRATLPATATDAEIRAAMAPKAVSQAAPFFGRQR